MHNGLLSLNAFIVTVIVVCGLSIPLIPLLKKLKANQPIRNYGPKTHLKKVGTPTMGGIMIIAAIVLVSLLFSLGDLTFIFPVLLVVTAHGILGFLDDILKLKYNDSDKGLKVYQKVVAQVALALVFALYLKNTLGTQIYLPFSNATWDLSWFYVPFAMIVIIATVNSVNLTDGLDGLASGVTLVYSIAMCIIFIYIGESSVAAGQMLFSGTGKLSIFAASVAGACLGFLYFNRYPAKVIMGDTGSMALGASVAAMALFSRAVLLLPIMGGCFLASSLSAIIQVISFKTRGKRVFLMAPLHHHFELKGIKEIKIARTYALITAILCLICLIAYV